MALSVKDPEADRLAREVTARTGETLTTAIVVALRERLARLRGRRRPPTAARRAPRNRAALCPAANVRRPLGRGDSRLRPTRIAPLMVLDTSALLTLLLHEPEAEEFR